MGNREKVDLKRLANEASQADAFLALITYRTKEGKLEHRVIKHDFREDDVSGSFLELTKLMTCEDRGRSARDLVA